MKKIIVGVLSAAFILGSFTILPTKASAADMTFRQLVELFISLGIIPSDKADAARGALSSATDPRSSCHAFNINLRIGDSGDEINALDRVLDQEGLLGATKDGFTEEVAAAVVKFQAKYGIPQTGYVGPLTREKLNTMGCANPAPEQPFTVTYPTAGAKLAIGKTYNLTWTGGDPAITSYSVYLVGGIYGASGSRYLGTAYTSQKSFSWTVPDLDLEGYSNYQIQFSGAGVTGDNSNNLFTIVSSDQSVPSAAVPVVSLLSKSINVQALPGNASTNYIVMATYKLSIQAKGGDITFDESSFSAPILFRDGSKSSQAVNFSTEFAIPSTGVVTDGRFGRFTIPENGTITLPVTFRFSSALANGDKLLAGKYSIGLDYINYSEAGGKSTVELPFGGTYNWLTDQVAIEGQAASNLSAYCTGSAWTLGAAWHATVNGGKAPYTYSWNILNDVSVYGEGSVLSSDIRVAYSSGGLKKASLIVTDTSGTSITVNCSATVLASTANPASAFTLSKASFDYTATEGDTQLQTQSLTFTNVTSSNIAFKILVENQPRWLNTGYSKDVLTAYPNQPFGLGASFDPKGLAVGNYRATIQITGLFPSTPILIPVNLTVAPRVSANSENPTISVIQEGSEKGDVRLIRVTMPSNTMSAQLALTCPSGLSAHPIVNMNMTVGSKELCNSTEDISTNASGVEVMFVNSTSLPLTASAAFRVQTSDAYDSARSASSQIIVPQSR